MDVRFDRPAMLPEILRLREDVREAVIDGMLMLQSRADVRAVKVSRTAAHLLPPLKNGVTLDQLCESFGRRLTDAQRGQVVAFLGVLQGAGLLQSSGTPSRAALVRYATWDLSGPLNRLGDAVRTSRAAASAAIAVMLFAVLAVLGGASAVFPHAAAIEHAAAQPLALAAGVLVLFAIVIPLHELTHAVVAGACGIERTRLVIARRGMMPVVFCETPGSSLIPGRLRRILVPAAGPLVDLGFAVLFGALALLATPAASYLAAAACASLIALIVDCNPFASSDGSRMIEIVLDDDHARASALSRRSGFATMRGAARAYLAVAVLYLTAIVALIGFFGVAISRAGGS